MELHTLSLRLTSESKHQLLNQANLSRCYLEKLTDDTRRGKLTVIMKPKRTFASISLKHQNQSKSRAPNPE